MDWSKWRHLFLWHVLLSADSFLVWCGGIYPFVKSSLTSASSISYFDANCILDTHKHYVSPGQRWTKCQYNFRCQISIRSVHKIKTPTSQKSQTDQFSTVFKFSPNKTNHILNFVVLYLRKTHYKPATFHKSPSVQGSWVNNRCL